MAEKPIFLDEELMKLIESVKEDADIAKMFNAVCLGPVDDLLPMNPYGYRAWL